MQWSIGWRRLCLASLAALVAAGCGSGGVGNTAPVSGSVTLDGQPLSAGLVSFNPDSSKGNSSQFVPVAQVDSDGRYTLTTEGKEGAPPGWYKATVTPGMPRMDPGADPSKTPMPKMITLNPKYGDAAKTPFSIEVIANAPAGHYDLKLSK
jgi:hypothetical protein